MAREISHDEISERFVQSGALNFEAMGKFVSEAGADLFGGDRGLHGVVFGRFNSLACMLPASDIAELVGNLRIASQVAEAINANSEGGLG